jgi:glycosyltransferase involved in cell wall biosynthesis
MRREQVKEGPLVSVIVPAYNRAGIIGETIENIFQQTYANIELIIVDDGSTDNTEKILKSYGERIRWITQKNAGPAAARNRGIGMAKGEIIAFQDSDDTWHRTKIERQVSILQRAGETVVCCICNSNMELPGFVVQSFDHAPINPPIEEGIWLNPAEILATRFILFNQAVAIRRKVLERMGGFDESFRVLEDVDLEMRLSLEGPWSFIRDPLATRQDKIKGSLSQGVPPRIISENVVRIREGILRAVECNNHLADLRPLMRRELKRARRGLRAVQIRERNAFGASAVGWGLERVEHYLGALSRRIPWQPKMKVSAVEPQVMQDAIHVL